MIERYNMVVHDMVISNLKFREIEFIDLTEKGGGLYFFDKSFADELKAGHYDVRYARNGTRRTRHRPAWYMSFDRNNSGEQLQPTADPASDHEDHSADHQIPKYQPVPRRKKKKKPGIPILVAIVIGLMLLGSANTNLFAKVLTGFGKGNRAVSHSQAYKTTTPTAKTAVVSPSALPTLSPTPFKPTTEAPTIVPTSAPTPTREATALQTVITVTATPRPTHDGTPEPKTKYIVNIWEKSKKIHLPGCQDIKRMADDNYEERVATYSELRAQGFSACGHCLHELYEMEKQQKDTK